MTKDRARKPRKAAAKSGLSVETTHTVAVETPLEAPISHEEAKETATSEQDVKNSSETPTPNKMRSIDTATVTSQTTGKVRPNNDVDIIPSSPSSSVPVPVTPLSARPTSREGRAKPPPPIIAPKPAALRRNSLPTPTETSQRQYQAVPTDKPPASRPLEVAPETPKAAISPATEASNENAIPANISVRAVASSWGKPVVNHAAELEKPLILRETDGLKQAVGAPDASPSGVSEPSEPSIVVPAVLNPPVVPMPQPRPRPISQISERRRSISNRYSAIILPPLKEEKTPAATPEGSLRIHTGQMGDNVPSAQALHDSLVSASITQGPSHRPERSQSLEVVEPEAPKANGHSPISPLDRTVVIGMLG
jgi:hypothetical protein